MARSSAAALSRRNGSTAAAAPAGPAPAPAPPSATAKAPKQQNTAQQAVELDRLIHERVRLGIISALAVNESLTFNELKRLLDSTDGNISVHARRLEEAGYVLCTKSFEGRVPRTEYRISAKGRAALEKYLNHMESLIGAMRAR